MYVPKARDHHFIILFARNEGGISTVYVDGNCHGLLDGHRHWHCLRLNHNRLGLLHDYLYLLGLLRYPILRPGKHDDSALGL